VTGFDDLNATLAETRARLFERRALCDELESIPMSVAAMLDRESIASLRAWGEPQDNPGLPKPEQRRAFRVVGLVVPPHLAGSYEPGEVFAVPEDCFAESCARGWCRPATEQEARDGHAQVHPIYRRLPLLRRLLFSSASRPGA